MLLFQFELFSVVVADDITHSRLFNSTFNRIEMEKALVALCMLRTVKYRHKRFQLTRDTCRIYHFVFGRAGMDRCPCYGYACGRSIEILVFDLADRAAVNSISVIRTEICDVKAVGSSSDLLVRRECNTHIPVRLSAFLETYHRIHYLRDTGFVVCAEKRRAVRNDNVVSDISFK